MTIKIKPSDRTPEILQRIDDTLVGLNSKDAVTKRLADTNFYEMWLASLTSDQFFKETGRSDAGSQRMLCEKYAINASNQLDARWRELTKLDGKVSEYYFRWKCKDRNTLRKLGLKPLLLPQDSFYILIGGLMAGEAAIEEVPEGTKFTDPLNRYTAVRFDGKVVYVFNPKGSWALGDESEDDQIVSEKDRAERKALRKEHADAVDELKELVMGLSRTETAYLYGRSTVAKYLKQDRQRIMGNWESLVALIDQSD